MGSESNMRGRIVKILHTAGLHPISVENSAYPGTPDINYLYGWIELKQVDAWPVRDTTPLRVDHMRPEQRIWLRARWRAGGAAYVLLRVASDWLLLAGDYAADQLGRATMGELTGHAIAYWPNHLDEKALISCLKITRPQT